MNAAIESSAKSTVGLADSQASNLRQRSGPMDDDTTKQVLNSVSRILATISNNIYSLSTSLTLTDSTSSATTINSQASPSSSSSSGSGLTQPAVIGIICGSVAILAFAAFLLYRYACRSRSSIAKEQLDIVMAGVTPSRISIIKAIGNKPAEIVISRKTEESPAPRVSEHDYDEYVATGYVKAAGHRIRAHPKLTSAPVHVIVPPMRLLVTETRMVEGCEWGKVHPIMFPYNFDKCNVITEGWTMLRDCRDKEPVVFWDKVAASLRSSR